MHPRASGNRGGFTCPRCSIPQTGSQELVTSQKTEQGGLPLCVRSPGLSTGSEDCPQREEGDANQPRATHTGTWAGGAGLRSGDRSLALICLQLCSLGRGPVALSSTIKLKNKMRWNIKPIKLVKRTIKTASTCSVLNLCPPQAAMMTQRGGWSSPLKHKELGLRATPKQPTPT